jgi:Cu(I)/Ag(I) efflux system membrane protein CusA/SilA
MNQQLRQFPEVETVFGKIGRSTSPTDPAPLSMVETVITLKPESQWPEKKSWDDLISEMDQALRVPGMPNIWWMPIQTRTEMLATGIRSALGIKVFGDDLESIEQTAVAIEQALQNDSRTAPFTRSAFAERLSGGYFIDFTIKRDAAARYGLNVQDVEDLLQAALGGVVATQTIEARERYSVLVRYGRDYRDSLPDLETLQVPTPLGHTIPITEVATISTTTGAPMIRNEDGQLVGFVFVDVHGNLGIADYVEVAKQVVNDKVMLPTGYRLAWAGQFQHFERAKATLTWVVPATLLLVLLLLYLHRGRLSDTLFVLSAVPFAITGSLGLLWLLDYKLSVAVWVGIIAMAGLAAEMGLLMLHYLDKSLHDKKHQDPIESIAHNAAERVRPMLMTSLTLLLSLIPIMLSDGTGADVMKRIAAPMVGGSIVTLIIVLFVFPALFFLWRLPAMGFHNTNGKRKQ